jgi:hypothetical protein
MVSSFLSRAGVQLVCIFRFFVAIVSPVRGRRALRRAPIGTGRPARARRHCREPALHASAPAKDGRAGCPHCARFL